MADQTYHVNSQKNIAEVLREMKYELLSFVETRYSLLSAEIKEKTVAWKASLPMLVFGVVFAMGTFATFTFTIVSLLATLIGTAYAWTFGCLIVCVVYAAVAATLLGSGYKRLTAQSLVPERTVRVLKQDQQWIKEETLEIKNQRAA